MHKGRISLENKSHIVSFDDARRSVRDGRTRSVSSPSSSSGRRSALSHRGATHSSFDQVNRGRSFTSASLADMPASSFAGTSATSARARSQHVERARYDQHARGDRARAPRVSYSRFGAASGAGYGDQGDFDREEASEPAAPEKKSFMSKLSDKMAAFRRLRAKDKADKRFAQQYGDGGASKAAAEAAGPRAAVYKGEMGSAHKRAASMQNSGGATRSGRGSSSAKRGRAFHPALLASVAVAACLLFGCVFLYGPAKTYYQEVRECDRLEAEYAALQARNEAIQGEVDALSTDAGIEDKARSEFGWVKEGENAVSVSGLDVEDESSFTANIVPGSVEAPDTWYSFLDPLFGVE